MSGRVERKSRNRKRRRAVKEANESSEKGQSGQQNGAIQKQRRKRPSAPRNTGQDLLNQKLQAAKTPSPREGSLGSLNRVFSMSNFQNNYGSNVAFQDLFDDAGGAPSASELSRVDVAAQVDEYDGGAPHENAMLHLLTQKLRTLTEENARLSAENARLVAELEKKPK